MARNRRLGQDQGQRVGVRRVQGSGTNIGDGGGSGGQTAIFTVVASGDNNQANRYEIPSEYRSGWIIEIGVGAASYESLTMNAKHCIWADDADGGHLLYAGPTQSWDRTFQWRRDFPTATTALRVEAGKRYWCGLWRDPNKSHTMRVITSNGTGQRGHVRTGSTPVESFTGFAYEDEALATEFFYQQNANPSIPAWVAPLEFPTEVPIFNSSEPVLTGTMPHDNGDGDLDYTQRVHAQIWREDTGAMLYDAEFEPTDAEKAAKRWSRSLTALPAATNLKARFRHQDSWGAWSNDFSPTTTFQVAQGPDAPVITAPSGKWNQISAFNYAGVYNHILNFQSNAIQIQVMNATGSQVIYDSGTVAKVVNAGANWTHPAWHLPLQWGTNYRAQIRFRSRNATNTADVWGPYSVVSFKTNSAPYIPQQMVPSGSIQSGTTELKATVRDPDGDQVTEVRIELFDIAANVMVGGYYGKNILLAKQSSVGADLSGFTAVNCSVSS